MSHGHDEVPRIEAGGGHGGGHDEGGEGWLVSYADMMTLLVGFFVILLSFSAVDEEKFEMVKKAATQEFGGTYHIPYGELTEHLKAELVKLKMGNQVAVKAMANGVEISFTGAVFFETGAADVKPEGITLLEGLIPIMQHEASDFDVVIEGHTDDVPISSKLKFGSNWELSSVRACRVLDVFQAKGFKKEQLTAVGYGEARAIVPNRDSVGNAIPQNQSQNRRVVIKLLKHAVPTVGETVPPAGDTNL